MFTPDPVLKGLYTKQLSTGSVWVLKAKLRGTRRTVSVTIGRTDVFNPQQARAEAKKSLAALSLGTDPNAKKKIAAEDQKKLGVTLQEALDEYLDAKTRKPATVQTYRAVFRRCFSDWMDHRLGEITKEQVRRRFIEIKKNISKRTNWKQQANEPGLAEALKAVKYLSAVMEYFVDDEYGDERVLPKGNPVKIIKAKRLKDPLLKRKRFLNDLERQDLLDHLSEASHPQYKGKLTPDEVDYLYLLMLTGMRRTEARTMLWNDVDFDNKTMTVRETKNGKPLTLPLTDAIGRVLKRRAESSNSPFVFPNADGTGPASLKHTVERVYAETGIKFCLHDLRRTVDTVAFNKGGYNLDQIAALLNHSKGDVTEGYVQWTLDTVRPIMQTVEDDLLKPYECDPNPPEPTEADDLALGLPAKERPASSNILSFRAGGRKQQ